MYTLCHLVYYLSSRFSLYGSLVNTSASSSWTQIQFSRTCNTSRHRTGKSDKLENEETYTGVLVPLFLGVRSDQHFVELLSHPGNCHLFPIFGLFWKDSKVHSPLDPKVLFGFLMIFTTHLQEKVSACPTTRPSAPCLWYSHGRACLLSPEKYPNS